MASSVGAFAGAVSRHWTIQEEGRTYHLELTHNTVLGTRSLSIDGCDVPGGCGSFFATSSPQTIVFQCGDDPKAKGKVEMWANRGTIYYQCSFRNEIIEEDYTSAPNTAPEQGGPLKFRVKIPDYVIAWDENGKAVTWYKMVTIQGVDGKGTVVHRRYRDFFNVNGSIKAALKGTNLFDKVPELPSRKHLFTSHFDENFLNERRAGLELYMQRLLSLPRITLNNDFLAHVGIIDNVREISMFFEPGPLGLSLEDHDNGVQIKEFPDVDGKPSPAKQSGLLQEDDRISKINGEDIIGLNFNIVLSKLKAAKRPVCVHFISYLRPLDSDNAKFVQDETTGDMEFGNTESATKGQNRVTEAGIAEGSGYHEEESGQSGDSEGL